MQVKTGRKLTEWGSILNVCNAAEQKKKYLGWHLVNNEWILHYWSVLKEFFLNIFWPKGISWCIIYFLWLSNDAVDYIIMKLGRYCTYEVKCYSTWVHWLRIWSAYSQNYSLGEWLRGMTEVPAVNKTNHDLYGSFLDKEKEKKILWLKWGLIYISIDLLSRFDY